MDRAQYFVINYKLDRIACQLDRIERKEDIMTGELTNLQAEVAETTTVTQSAIVLLNGLAAQLAAAIASGDPNALVALHDSLKTSTDALAAAVAANTPAAPTPVA